MAKGAKPHARSGRSPRTAGRAPAARTAPADAATSDDAPAAEVPPVDAEAPGQDAAAADTGPDAAAEAPLNRAARRAKAAGRVPPPEAGSKIHGSARFNPVQPRQWTARRSG